MLLPAAPWRVSWWAVVVVPALLAACGQPPRTFRYDTTDPAATTVVGELGGIAEPVSDSAVLDHLRDVDLMQVSLGRLAADRAGRDVVKAFARRMISEHDPHDAGGMAATSGMDHQNEARLAAREGLDFDVEYLDAMIASHEERLAFLLRAFSVRRGPALDSTLARARTAEAAHLDAAWKIRKTLAP